MSEPTSPLPNQAPSNLKPAASAPERRVIMVKKRLRSGEPCAKCGQAEQLLRDRRLWQNVDEVVWADERDDDSAGMRLAKEHNVTLAPFFLVQEPGKPVAVYTSTLKVVGLLEAAQPKPATAAGGASTGAASAAELQDLAVRLENAEPAEIVATALRRFGAECTLAFSGAEDVVLIDWAKASGLPFQVFCLDTGRLHPETYRFIDRVRRHYGVEITLMAPETAPLEAFVRRKGLFSFYEDGHGECCGIRQVEPLVRALAGRSAWISGQRRDQSPATRSDLRVVEADTSRAGAGRLLPKFNPLVNWSSEQVWTYIREQRVPYNELHDRGFVSIGCEPCTRARRPGEHERAARWWWEESTQRECGLHVARH
jgi:phosphoadenosine phosphosulfate reductase